MSYNAKNYTEQGGEKTVVGGEIEVLGKIKATGEIDMLPLRKIVKVALTAGNADAYALAWQNPESVKIIIERVLVHLTTAGGTGSSALELGAAATATTESDNLINGLDLNTTGLFDNISDGGTNGKSRALLDEKGGTADFVTGRIKAQNAADLVGNAYIVYFQV